MAIKNKEKISMDVDYIVKEFVKRNLKTNHAYIIKKNPAQKSTQALKTTTFTYKDLLILMISGIASHLLVQCILEEPELIDTKEDIETLMDISDYEVTISEKELKFTEIIKTGNKDHYTYNFHNASLLKNKQLLNQDMYPDFYTKLSQVVLDIKNNKVDLLKMREKNGC